MPRSGSEAVVGLANSGSACTSPHMQSATHSKKAGRVPGRIGDFHGGTDLGGLSVRARVTNLRKQRSRGSSIESDQAQFKTKR